MMIYSYENGCFNFNITDFAQGGGLPESMWYTYLAHVAAFLSNVIEPGL